MSINGETVEIQTKVDDYDQAIRSLETAVDGRIWVLSGRGTHEQPEGILRTYDVFDTEGHFREVVLLAGEMDEKEDRLYWLADGRWVILRNIRSALSAMYAQFRDDTAEEELPVGEAALEVVCLRAGSH